MKLRKIAFTAVAVGALTVTAACGGSDSDGGDGGSGAGSEAKTADYNPQPRENLKDGGELTTHIGEITEQWNPFHGDGSVDAETLTEWYTPQLLLVTPEGEVSKHDAYLDDYKIEEVDGNTQIMFTFNEDAVWNDGTPMDWTTIEATWKANNGKNDAYNANSTDGYDRIKSVKPGDTDKTAIVTYDGTWPWADGQFSNILHPSVDTPKKYNEMFINNPHPELGAGPFKLEKFDKQAKRVTFVPNEKWWGEEPKLDKRTFVEMSETAHLNAFKNGEIDAAETRTKDRLAQVEDMEGVEIYSATRPANNLFQLDAEDPLLTDLNVRKAIMMGIDRTVITDVMFDGLGYEEELPGSFNLYTFQEGYVDALSEAGYEYNPEAAAKLLEDAGWTEGSDGIREKDGKKLSLMLPYWGDDPVTEARAKAVNAMLKEIGVEINVKQRPESAFSDEYSGKKWDAVMLGFTSSDPYGLAYFCQLYCSDSGLNLSGAGTAELDKKIKANQALPTAEEQIEEGMKLEAEVMSKTWGIMPLYNGPWIIAAKEGLANLTPEPYSGLDAFGVHPVENVGWEK